MKDIEIEESLYQVRIGRVTPCEVKSYLRSLSPEDRELEVARMRDCDSDMSNDEYKTKWPLKSSPCPKCGSTSVTPREYPPAKSETAYTHEWCLSCGHHFDGRSEKSL